MRIASRQQHVGNRGEKILLEAVDDKGERIRPLESAKILGIIFIKTLSWSSHLDIGKEALIPKLKKKLGALKFTSKYATYKAKLKLANGCIMSHIIYGIQICGLHSSTNIIRRVQSVQTNTLKWVTSSYNSSLTDLLKITKWLSLHQLSVYHAVILWWKVKKSNKPARLLQRTFKIQESEARLLLTEKIWSRKAEFYFRKVEPIIGGIVSISTVKTLLRQWIKFNIPIYAE